MSQITELEYAKKWWSKLPVSIQFHTKNNHGFVKTPVEFLKDEEILHIFRNAVLEPWWRGTKNKKERAESANHQPQYPDVIFEAYRREVVEKEPTVFADFAYTGEDCSRCFGRGCYEDVEACPQCGGKGHKKRDSDKIGLFDKYYVGRTDGTPMNPNNRYFLLKVEGEGDPVHIAACRKAVTVYAEEIKDHLPELSKDLLTRYAPSK